MNECMCYYHNLFSHEQNWAEHTRLLWWIQVGHWCWHLRRYVFCFNVICFNCKKFIHGNWIFKIKYIKHVHVIEVWFLSECNPGYSGPGCVISCPFPLYGENCQNICKCSATKYCNFIYGCLESKYSL